MTGCAQGRGAVIALCGLESKVTHLPGEKNALLCTTRVGGDELGLRESCRARYSRTSCVE